MKTATVIAEFNPFHNGHKYLFDTIRKETKADYIVVFMSGNYVQRGLPAITDKFTRAGIAVMEGADAVFELPVVYSTASAADFAFGGVSLADALGCADILVFGSETGNIHELRKAAAFIDEESPEFKETLRENLRNGSSYPAALQKTADALAPDISSLLLGANNTLGIEYIRSLNKLNSNVEPVTLKRTGNSHGSSDIVKDEGSDLCFTSASHIRELIETSNNTDLLHSVLPRHAYDQLQKDYTKKMPIISSDFSLLLSQKLDTMSIDDISCLLGANKDIASRIKKASVSCNNIEDLRNSISNRSITDAQINRILLHALLDIYEEDTDRTCGSKYLRLLAMNRQSSPLLKKIKNTAAVPVITKMADFEFDACNMLMKDIKSSNLYYRVMSNKYGLEYSNDIMRSPVII